MTKEERKEKTEDAQYLVNTSVNDMQSSLHCSLLNGTLDLDMLMIARRIVRKRGEITKELIIVKYIKKLLQ